LGYQARRSTTACLNNVSRVGDTSRTFTRIHHCIGIKTEEQVPFEHTRIYGVRDGDGHFEPFGVVGGRWRLGGRASIHEEMVGVRGRSWRASRRSKRNGEKDHAVSRTRQF